MTGGEKHDCLIEVTAWAGLTVFYFVYIDRSLLLQLLLCMVNI